MNEVSKLINRTIREVVIDSTVITIGERAFWYCTSLTSVTIGNSVTSIGNFAFYDCTSLNELHFTNPVAPTIGELPWYGLKYVYVPEGSVEAYRNAFKGKICSDKQVGYTLDPSTFVFSYQVPYWEEQSFECEVDGTGTKTGMVTVVEKDTNPSSPTCNQERTRTYEDLKRCNPSGGLFTKITSLDDVTSGKYLIVDTSVNKALNASLIKDTTTAKDGINVYNNVIYVTIENDTIAADVNTLNAAADYDADNKTLSWTDTENEQSYFIQWKSGSNYAYDYDRFHQLNKTIPKSVNDNITFNTSGSGSARSIGKHTSHDTIKFYSEINTSYYTSIALFKLN